MTLTLDEEYELLCTVWDRYRTLLLDLREAERIPDEAFEGVIPVSLLVKAFGQSLDDDLVLALRTVQEWEEATPGTGFGYLSAHMGSVSSHGFWLGYHYAIAKMEAVRMAGREGLAYDRSSTEDVLP